MAFKIEREPRKNKTSRPHSPKYPWATLEVDTSFVVPIGENEASLRTSLYQNGKAWFLRNKKSDVTLSIEKINDNELRVHRTA